MAPPRELIHVEWMAARDWDHPNDRRPRKRTFSREADAADQILSILAWPSHLELVAVSRSTPSWAPVDPAELAPAEESVARHAELLDGWRSNPAVQTMAERVAGHEPQESHAS